MCRDQNLISETDGRADGRAKIEKRGVGRPLLGPAIITKLQKINKLKTESVKILEEIYCD